MTKTIIVVDDSQTARRQVCLALAEEDYEIVEAVDGLDGLAKIAAHADASLIICDVNMPNMNGIEMLQALRSEHPSVQVPIIMLTTEALPALLNQAKQAGAKGWIVKPFATKMLISAVRKLASG